MDPTTQRLISSSNVEITNRDTQVIFVSLSVTTLADGKRLAAYSWTDSGGFGTKYADPVDASATAPVGLQPTTQNNGLLVLNATSPYLYAYDFDIDTGWGGVTSFTTTPSGVGPDSLLRHPTEDEFIFNTSTHYYITKYKRNVGFTLVEEAAAPGNTPLSMGINPSGNVVAIGTNSTPFIEAYQYTVGAGLGTAYSNPASPASGAVNTIAWLPNNSGVATAHSATPFTTTWNWNNSTGFGSRYQPTSPGGTTQANYGIAATTKAIIVGHYISPFLFAYPFTPGSGYGTAYSNPSTLPINDTRTVVFNADYSVVFVGTIASTTSVTINAYAWDDNTGFGTRYSNPTPTISGAVDYITVMNGRDPRRGYGL